MKIFLPNVVDPKHFDEVEHEMKARGAPTIRVVDFGDHYVALEGSHRMTAALILGVAPNLVRLHPDDLVTTRGLDFSEYVVGTDDLITARGVATALRKSDWCNPSVKLRADGTLADYNENDRWRSREQKREERERQRKIQEAMHEEREVLDRMQALAERGMTLDEIAAEAGLDPRIRTYFGAEAETDLDPWMFAELLSDIVGEKGYTDLQSAIEVWLGE